MEQVDQAAQHGAIDQKSRFRGRFQKGVLVALALWTLWTLSLCAMVGRRALLNTETLAAVRAQAGADFGMALVLMPVVLMLYAWGYGCSRFCAARRPLVRGFPLWMAGMARPLLAAVVLVGWAGLDRVFPGRLLQRYAGLELPHGARIIHLHYDGPILETEVSRNALRPGGTSSGNRWWHHRTLVKNLIGTPEGRGNERNRTRSFQPVCQDLPRPSGVLFQTTLRPGGATTGYRAKSLRDTLKTTMQLPI